MRFCKPAKRMPNPVVITRPLAQAQDLLERISSLGRDAVLFPLLEISPLPDDGVLRATLANLQRYDMVAFVSPNAIDAAFRLIEHWPSNVAVAVVGEGSRKALERHGLTDANARIFRPLDPARSDSETLLQALDMKALRGKKVLVVRGEAGRELLSDALHAAGVEVEQVAAYRRSAPALDEQGRAQLRALLASDCTWIVTSSEALRHLVDMVNDVALAPGLERLRRQRLIVPHVRIAQIAHSLDFHNVILTGSGDESLFAALQCSP